MSYNGTAENKFFDGRTYLIDSCRDSDGNVQHIFKTAEGNVMKTQTISFEESGSKMIFTESGNGVSMTTTFVKC